MSHATTPMPSGVSTRRATWAVCLGVAVVGLTTTAITVGTRGMAEELHASFETLGWIVNAYLLAAASCALLGGRLGDVLGRSHTFMLGLAVFAAGSALGLVAPGATVLIVARAAQGVGAALLLPASIEIVAAYWPRGTETSGFSARAVTYATAFAVGPLVGGLLTDNLSWRWIFAFDLALLAVAAIVAWPLFTSRSHLERKPTRDWRGAALVALLAFLVVITAQRTRAWGVPSTQLWGMVLLIAVVALALVVVERRTEHPLVHPDLLRSRQLIGANVATFGASLGMVSLLYFFNLFAQSAALFDATVFAVLVALTPFIASMIAFAHLAAWLRRHVGVWAPAAGGMALMVVGFAALSLTTVDSTKTTLAVPLILSGIGAGIANAGLTGAAVLGLPAGRLNEAAGIVSLTRFLGSALALAIGTSAYLAVSVDSAARSEPPPTSTEQVAFGGKAFHRAVEQLDEDLRAPFEAAVQTDSAAAFADTMRITAVLVGGSLVVGAWMLRPSRPTRLREATATPS